MMSTRSLLMAVNLKVGDHPLTRAQELMMRPETKSRFLTMDLTSRAWARTSYLKKWTKS